MRHSRRADVDQRKRPADPADQHDRAEQLEAGPLALDMPDAAHEPDADRAQQAGQIAQVAVEIGRQRPFRQPKSSTFIRKKFENKT